MNRDSNVYGIHYYIFFVFDFIYAVTGTKSPSMYFLNFNSKYLKFFQ